MNDSRRRQIAWVQDQLRRRQADIWRIKQEEIRYLDWLEEEERINPGTEEYEKVKDYCDFMQQAMQGLEDAIGNLDELLPKPGQNGGAYADTE